MQLVEENIHAKLKHNGGNCLWGEKSKENLNYSDNFVGLTERANKSKGSKTYEEWIIYKKEGIYIRESFRREMIAKERQLESIIQKMIDEYNGK